MKYGLGIKLLISFIVGGIAVLYKIRINPKFNESEITSVVNVPKTFLFNLLTTSKNVPTYFSWIKRFREIDTRKNLTIGKEYRGTISMPFLGQHEVRYLVSEVQQGQWVILKSDPIHGTYLNPEIVFMLNEINPMKTQFYMKIMYQRNSALFQISLGPVLKWLTDYQLKRVCKKVDAFARTKWSESRETQDNKMHANKPVERTKPKQNTTASPTRTQRKKVVHDEQ